MNKNSYLPLVLVAALVITAIPGSRAHAALSSPWMDPGRIMVIYNTTRMDSVDPAEPDTFSHDMGEWYMKRYNMPTRHLFGYDMGRKVKWDNPGAFKFLQAVADYIEQNRIQVVLLAPGTPLIVRDTNNYHDLALDSLVGHALWFAHVKKEAPACRARRSVAPRNCNLYFPYLDMGDGASPFVVRTRDASRWGIRGRDLMINGREWYDTMMKDLRDHPSVRPFGRIGLPYYLEVWPARMPKPRSKPGKKNAKAKSKDQTGKAEKKTEAGKPKTPPMPGVEALKIPLENSKFVKDLVNGGFAATTSIREFNAQTSRCLLFFGREGNTTYFIDVESSISEAMAQDAIMQGIDPRRIIRIKSRRGWPASCPLKEPAWNYTADEFMKGLIKPPINPLIFTAGGVNNTTEGVTPWPNSLDVQPGLVASVSVSNGKAFAGSLLRRGATTIVVNLHHPQDSRLHAWFSVFRQLVGGATVCEAMMTSGGAERGGYISGSVWGDPLYAPFGKNRNKVLWFTGGKK